MNPVCPFCKKELKREHMIAYQDYHCFPSLPDHHYTARMKDDQILQIKIRLRSPNGSNLFLKLHFDDGFSEVWTKKNEGNRIKINHVFMPDFDQPEKLVRKIITYLTFS